MFSPATLARAVIVILLATVFAAALAQQTINKGLLSRDQLPASNGKKEDDGNQQDPAVPLQTRVNKKAGYSFGFPVGWKVVSEGSLSRITSPDRKVVISLGVAPAGSLAAASSEFLQLLRRDYNAVRFRDRDSVTINRARAARVTGNAVNQHDVAIRFTAVTLTRGGRNFTIAAFYDPDTKVGNVESFFDAIAASFRTIEPA